jgi:hypothetical protein
MKFPEKTLEQLYDDEEVEGYKLVELGEFHSEQKYEYADMIFQDTSTGKHYSCSVSRAGSYYSDHQYYFDEECPEVELKKITVKKWVPVRDKKQ